MRTKAKICGITNAEDARLCFELGADYLGLIFATGVRRVTLQRAAEIRRAVPLAALVGVFADESADYVDLAVRTCSLDLVQLHGGEPPHYVRELAERCGVPIIKAITDRSQDPLEYRDADFLMFDLAKDAGGAGGGVAEVWRRAAEAAARGRSVFLAGGLTPDNVAEAIRKVRPWCVDVCSGVESSPGRKDPAAVARFLREISE